jgi:hypothetical protein
MTPVPTSTKTLTSATHPDDDGSVSMKSNGIANGAVITNGKSNGYSSATNGNGSIMNNKLSTNGKLHEKSENFMFKVRKIKCTLHFKAFIY